MINIRLSQIRNFIITERLYVYLLMFIISVNIALALTGEKRPERFTAKVIKASVTKEDLTRLIQRDKKLGAAVMLSSLSIFFAIAIGLFLDFIILILKKKAENFCFPPFHIKRQSGAYGMRVKS